MVVNPFYSKILHNRLLTEKLDIDRLVQIHLKPFNIIVRTTQKAAKNLFEVITSLTSASVQTNNCIIKHAETLLQTIVHYHQQQQQY